MRRAQNLLLFLFLAISGCHGQVVVCGTASTPGCSTFQSLVGPITLQNGFPLLSSATEVEMRNAINDILTVDNNVSENVFNATRRHDEIQL